MFDSFIMKEKVNEASEKKTHLFRIPSKPSARKKGETEVGAERGKNW
jgi:hypothetical protein